MSASTERVKEYLRQRKLMKSNQSDQIHGIHSDPDAEMADLLVADVEALLEAADRYEDLEH